MTQEQEAATKGDVWAIQEEQLFFLKRSSFRCLAYGKFWKRWSIPTMWTVLISCALFTRELDNTAGLTSELRATPTFQNLRKRYSRGHQHSLQVLEQNENSLGRRERWRLCL